MDRRPDSGESATRKGFAGARLAAAGCIVIALVGAALVLLMDAPVSPTTAQVPPTPTSTPTPTFPTPPGGRVTETPTSTPTDTPTATATATPTRTKTPTPTRTPRLSPTPTSTPTPTATAAPTNTPAVIDISTPTPTPTVSIATVPPSGPPVAVETPTPTPLSLVVPTPTNTPLSLGVPTFTPTMGAFQGPGASQVDYSAWAMEVTQGIQNLANEMPLVTGRLTAVRLYVKVEPDVPDSDVTGALGGWRKGKFLGVLYPENGPVFAAASGGSRTAIDHSLYFYLPSSWASGEVKLKGVVFAGDPSTLEFEPNDDNNYFEVDVTFQPAAPMKLRLLPIHVHAQPSPNSPETTFLYSENQAVALQVIVDMYRLHPIAELSWDTSLEIPQQIVVGEILGQPVVLEAVVMAPVLPLDHAIGGEFDESTSAGRHEVNLALSLLKMWTPPELADYRWYGMVPATHNMGGFIGWASYSVAHGIMSNGTDTANWNLVGGIAMAHEIAHFVMSGPDHNKCSGTEAAGGDLDPGWPYPPPNCSMSGVDPEGYYGFDVYWAFWGNILNGPTIISNDPAQADPQRGFPLMGYVTPWWADPYNYCKLLDAYGVACDVAAINIRRPGADGKNVGVAPPATTHQHAAQPARNNYPQVQKGDYAFVAGTVESTGTAQLERIVRISDPAGQVVEESRQQVLAMAAAPEEASLVIEDGSGRALATYRLSRIEPAAHGSDDRSLHFALVLPWPDGAAKVVVRRGGASLDERAGSANRPTVRLTTTNNGGSLSLPVDIAWQASDPDGDQLSFSVLYSNDDGQTWRPLAAEIQARALRLTTYKGLPGTSKGRFKVVASDGFHAAEDVSDRAFRVPNSPPEVAILSPRTGTTARQGATVVLQGIASDLEDTPQAPGRVRWTSNLDGRLGDQVQLLVRTLRPGRHRLSFSATDSDGATATAEVEITIGSGGAVELPSGRDVDAIEKLLGAGGGDGGLGPLVWLAAGAGVLALGAAAATWVLRSRGRSGAAGAPAPPDPTP